MNANDILRQGGGILRGALGGAQRAAGRVAGEAGSIVSEAWALSRGRPDPGRRSAKPEMDDVTLAQKVQSEIFRGRGGSALKAAVNVNAVDGVVWLRGEVKRPQQIRALEEKARAVPEVRGVENLLHLVKTPAPARADTPKRQQRTRSSTRRPAPRTRTGGRVTDDRTDALTPQAEPSPADHAAAGEGRTPAPFGSAGDARGEPGGGGGEPGGGGGEPGGGRGEPGGGRGEPGGGSGEPGGGGGAGTA